MQRGLNRGIPFVEWRTHRYMVLITVHELSLNSKQFEILLHHALGSAR